MYKALCILYVVVSLLPAEVPLSLDIVAGVNLSHVETVGDVDEYFYPIAGKNEKLTGLHCGIEGNVSLTQFFMLNGGMHYQKCGVETGSSKVTFPGSNTPDDLHTLSTHHIFSYLSFPIKAKFGYSFEKQWVYFGAGPTISWRTAYESYWLVDEKVSTIPPSLDFNQWDLALTGSLEYGFRFDEKNGAHVSASYQLGDLNLVKGGLDGEAYHRVASFLIGYRYFF